MSSLSPSDMRFLETALEMQSGYCLDFSDRTFANFFADILNVNIDEQRYHTSGSSKGRRMRLFLKSEPDHRVARLLRALWEYRADMTKAGLTSPDQSGMEPRFNAVVDRLERSGAHLSTDAIDRFAPDETLEELVASIRRDVEAGSPGTALDHLHTYCMKKLTYLLAELDPAAKPAATLNARFGQYLSASRRSAKTHHPISFKIMTGAIETFELFNSVRNDRSLAHDNVLIERAEARFIFEAIVNVLRFIKATEGQTFGV